MLTYCHPHILPAIEEFPGGLLPARNRETGKLLLILKVHKEYILAARTNGGFSVYLAPLPSTSGLTVALVTAFFDDGDEPLAVKTPLFHGPESHDLLELLSYNELDVYFFDEHGREWMGYRASMQDQGSLLFIAEEFVLFSYHPEIVNTIYEALERWFGCRTTKDDANAIKITFNDPLLRPDIAIIDTRYDNHDYYGSGGISHSWVERENPGYFQERDIIMCLKRAFRGEQLAINPMRRDNGKELVDVLAANQTHLLLVQAKDSPNTKASLSRTIDRKRKTSHGKIHEAVRQARGAAGYVREQPKLELSIEKKHFVIDVGDKKIVSLVVVQEIFRRDGDAFVAYYRDKAWSGNVFVILDYSALYAFCHEFSDERRLLDAFTDYSAKIVAGGSWINPRTYVLKFIQERLSKLR